ncbi:MAG: glycosyltransferase family A protein [Acidimicrobiia bacterium]
MTTYLVTSDEARDSATLAYARNALRGDDWTAIGVDHHRVPRRDRKGRGAEGLFKHTPEQLLRSWRVARHLTRATKPGDVVIASDLGGLLGVFALEQPSLPEAQRRSVWTVAADSAFLELRLTGGTHAGLTSPLEHAIDWEIVQYRLSNRVLATSDRAVEELARLGVVSELIGEPLSSATPESLRPSVTVWVPGMVSRRGRSGDILRAVSTVEGVTVTLSNGDTEDTIWNGTAWEALRHVREVLGPRVQRGDLPSNRPDLLVVGDPYWPPDVSTVNFHEEGVPLAVPDGSVGVRLWPGAARWESVDDLVSILRGSTPTPRLLERTEIPESPRPNPDRARRISVGIPIFRDVDYLDECIESVMAQHLAPTEIVLVDDGSASPEVTEALRMWAERDGRIRALEGEHRGVCVARNRALGEMTGDSFLLLDADDTLEPTYLERCATALRSDEGLWAVASWTRFFGAYEGVEAKPPFDARVGVRENSIVSTSGLVDMRVRDLGIRFVPELAFLYCEDWHFWSQIVAAGGRIGLVPEALTNHRVHEASGGYLRTDLAYAVGKSRATAPLACADRRIHPV